MIRFCSWCRCLIGDDGQPQGAPVELDRTRADITDGLCDSCKARHFKMPPLETEAHEERRDA